MRSPSRVNRAATLFAIIVAALGWNPMAGSAEPAVQAGQERIGIYDSRAVAVAFAGSPVHQRELQELKAAHQRAKEAGNSAEVSRCESAGRAQQQALHRQGFGTAPVDDLLARITNALPAIRRKTGVSVLVSKWDENSLKAHARAERVDVTMELVDAFQPNERQRRYAEEIQKQKPLTPEQLERMKD